MKNIWTLVLSAITGLSVIIGTAFAIDGRFAKQAEHMHLASAFENYVTENKYDKTQERIWDTEDRLETTENGEAREQLKKRLRELQDQKERLEKKMQGGGEMK